jgi:hypothetical protein
MHQVIALLLLLTLGLSAPAGGGPLRVCLAALIQAQVQDSDCCGDCGDCGVTHGEKAPCCVELEKLPDAQTPSPMPVAPDAPVVDLGWQAVMVVPDLDTFTDRIEPATPIRGPTSASSRRAMLAIWRL